MELKSVTATMLCRNSLAALFLKESFLYKVYQPTYLLGRCCHLTLSEILPFSKPIVFTRQLLVKLQ